MEDYKKSFIKAGNKFKCKEYDEVEITGVEKS